MQPINGQPNTDDRGKIVSLPCPTQVNHREISRKYSGSGTLRPYCKNESYDISLPKDRPYLRTKGNSPLYPNREVPPHLNPVSSIKWRHWNVLNHLDSGCLLCVCPGYRHRGALWGPQLLPLHPHLRQVNLKMRHFYSYGYILFKTCVVMAIFSLPALLHSLFSLCHEFVSLLIQWHDS